MVQAREEFKDTLIPSLTLVDKIMSSEMVEGEKKKKIEKGKKKFKTSG